MTRANKSKYDLNQKRSWRNSVLPTCRSNMQYNYWWPPSLSSQRKLHVAGRIALLVEAIFVLSIRGYLIHLAAQLCPTSLLIFKLLFSCDRLYLKIHRAWMSMTNINTPDLCIIIWWRSNNSKWIVYTFQQYLIVTHPAVGQKMFGRTSQQWSTDTPDKKIYKT